MSVQWGNKAHKKRIQEQEKLIRENQKKEVGLFFAAIAVTVLYMLVLAGGVWLKEQAHRPSGAAVQANPGPASAPSPPR